MEKTTTVTVSKSTWKKLVKLRITLGAKTLDEVIISLLKKPK